MAQGVSSAKSSFLFLRGSPLQFLINEPETPIRTALVAGSGRNIGGAGWLCSTDISNGLFRASFIYHHSSLSSQLTMSQNPGRQTDFPIWANDIQVRPDTDKMGDCQKKLATAIMGIYY
jgi:hypothetical protein